MLKCIFNLLILILLPVRLFSQSDNQLWLDYQLDYPFKNIFLFENTTSYQTIISGENKWRNFSLSPVFEYRNFRLIDFIGSLPFAYTQQKEDTNTFEITTSLGFRFNISTGHRIDAHVVYKLEERFQRQLEENDWDKSNRSRLKGEIRICINGPNLFADNLWWAILDYEGFFVSDQQLDERYAYLRRARFGIGYRLNYKNRFEFVYSLQHSRNEIGDQFINRDNIFQLRYKMYLNPGRVSTTGEL